MQIVSVTRRFHFESAHFLPHVREGHKCRAMHGHNYVGEVELFCAVSDLDKGPPTERGFVMDFWDIDKILALILQKVDHKVLNHVEGLENPTAENIARWFWHRIEVLLANHLESLPDESCDDRVRLNKIRIYETPDCWAEVY